MRLILKHFCYVITFETLVSIRLKLQCEEFESLKVEFHYKKNKKKNNRLMILTMESGVITKMIQNQSCN